MNVALVTTKLLILLFAFNVACSTCFARGQAVLSSGGEREVFSTAKWKHEEKFRTDRVKQFCAFLERFNLIGMSREDLVRHLGDNQAYKGTSSSDYFEYWIESGTCGCNGVKIEMQLEGNKVARWSEAGTRACYDYQGSWISQNVLATPRTGRHNQFRLLLTRKSLKPLTCPSESSH